METTITLPSAKTLQEVLRAWAERALRVRYATGISLHQAARHAVPEPLQTPKILHAVETIMYFEEFMKSLDREEKGGYNVEVNREGYGHKSDSASGEVSLFGSAPDGGP